MSTLNILHEYKDETLRRITNFEADKNQPGTRVRLAVMTDCDVLHIANFCKTKATGLNRSLDLPRHHHHHFRCQKPQPC